MDDRIFELKAVNRGRRTWRLSFQDTAIALREVDGAGSADVSRDEIHEKAWLQRYLGRILLNVNIPKRLSLEASEDFLAVFEKWRGPLSVRDLSVALKRRLSWTIPIGALYIFLALPTAALPFDEIAFLLGCIAVVLGLLRFVWVSRTLFLFDMVWFFALALDVVLDVREGANWLWLPFAAFIAWVGIGSLREYDRFETVVANAEPSA